MKKALIALFQFVLFLLIFFFGSILPPFHFEHIILATPGSTRIFIADGLLLTLVLYVLIVIVQVLRKRLRTATPWTTLALILAIVFGLMMKFGFLTRSTF
jgi:hypothetical protein